MRIKLIFIRHGQTNWTKNKRLQGRLDIPLDRKGRRQIKKIANELKMKGEKPDLIISSPLKRTRQSAAIIAHTFKVMFTIDRNLSEKDLGDLTGKTWKEVKRNYKFVSKKLDRKRYYDYSLYNGESVDQVRERVKKFLDNINRKHNHNKTIIVVTHAGILSILLHEFFYNQVKDFPVKINPACCYICNYNGH